MAANIVYAAGNPDLYPIEYYNSETESFEGILPSLLESFSSQSGYSIQYYMPEEGDLRAQLGVNQQVDIISGCTEEEDWEAYTSITVFQAEEKGEMVSYQICLTEAAPDGLEEALRNFVSDLSTEKQIGFVLENTGDPAPEAMVYGSWILGSITALCLVFAIAALVFRKKYKRYRQRYQVMQTCDPVTGLQNRQGMIRWYNEHIDSKNIVLYEVVYFKIAARFSENLNFLEMKEEILTGISEILQRYIGEKEIGARVSEWDIALLKGAGKPEKETAWIEEAEEQIVEYLQKKLAVDDSGIVTAGIYPLANGGVDPEEGLFYGNQCAIAARRRGNTCLLCTEEIKKKIQEEVFLKEDIRDALKNDEMEIYLQFYVDGKSLRVIGGEALMRWDHPERGLLEPARFVPLLEQEGLISAIDYYCLEKVCDFLEDLQKEGIRDFFISCNFSRKTFSKKDFVERWEEILCKHKISRNSLAFELTESIPPENLEQLHRNMIETRKRGIRLFLDDFGEGFASFYDLREYPVDAIKLDKQLTDQVNTAKGNTILEAMIRLGHKMGVQMYVEGVEEQAQIEKLQKIGCDVIQGYYFHYPAPLWDVRWNLIERFHAEVKQAAEMPAMGERAVRYGERMENKAGDERTLPLKKIFRQIREIIEKQ